MAPANPYLSPARYSGPAGGGYSGPAGYQGPAGTPWPPPARRRRSPAVVIAAVAAVAAVAAAAVVAVVLVGHGHHPSQANEVGTRPTTHVSSASTSPSASAAASAAGSATTLPSASPAVTPATPAPDPAASAQASTVSTLLASGNGSANALTSAVADVQNCGDIPSDISEIQSVENQRQSEYSQAQSTAMNDLPDGTDLQTDLVQALNYSLQADSAYLDYANQMESSSCQSGSQAAAQAADSQAVGYKDQFLSLWNPIAGDYSLPQLTVSNI